MIYVGEEMLFCFLLVGMGYGDWVLKLLDGNINFVISNMFFFNFKSCFI